MRLTETNLAEVGSTADSALRAKLLNACQRVMCAGECIGPYHWIVEQQAKLHATRPDLYEWGRVDIRLRVLENEVARPEFLTDDSLAGEMYADFKATQKEFKRVYRDAREKFPIPDEDRKDITVEDVINLSVMQKSHWGLAGDIYERYSGKRLGEDEARAFAKACPPFEAMLLSTCIAQYDLAVQHIRAPRLYDAGRVDLMCSAYLPYCDRFVTNDPGQFNALTAIVKRMGLGTQVITYEDFCRSWLLAA